MNPIHSISKIVKKTWLQFQLQRIIDQQALLDMSLSEAEQEAELLGRVHEEQTTVLAKKRTALRSQLIRL